MAESGTIVISAVGAREDCSDRLSFLYDRKYGKKVGTLKGFMMLAGSGGALAFITYVFTDNLSTAIIISVLRLALSLLHIQK